MATSPINGWWTHLQAVRVSKHAIVVETVVCIEFGILNQHSAKSSDSVVKTEFIWGW